MVSSLCHVNLLLCPELGRKVRREQARQKQGHDAHSRFREFAVGDEVMIHDGRDKSLWRPGTVMELRGPVSYQVQLESGVFSTGMSTIFVGGCQHV